MDAPAQGRAGFVAIVGRPNVGKSTLLNRVLGEKLAIVSHHPQTTRNRILGIHTVGADQIVFLDTPGIHRRRANLNRFMVQEALDSLQGADCIVIVTEVAAAADPGAAALDPADRYVLEQIRLHGAGATVVVAINKIDRLRDRGVLLPLMAAWAEGGFERLLPISALDGTGVPALLDEVLALLPRGSHHFPADMFTDRAERFLAAELVREQVFLCCRQEVPYSTAVEVVRFDERPERGDVCIEALIHVERDSQRAILVGKRGATVKKIGMAARQEIAQLLGCTVHLKLTVHLEQDWSHSPQSRRRLGYE
jgi:GTPase